MKLKLKTTSKMLVLRILCMCQLFRKLLFIFIISITPSVGMKQTHNKVLKTIKLLQWKREACNASPIVLELGINRISRPAFKVCEHWNSHYLNSDLPLFIQMNVCLYVLYKILNYALNFTMILTKWLFMGQQNLR